MLDFHVLAPFILSSLILNFLPGPDMAYVMAQTLSRDKKGGIASVLGISAGIFIHTMIAACGLSILLMKSATCFWIIKVAGACYLLYLGLKLLTAQAKLTTPNSIAQGEILYVFKQGFLTNLFNPKIILFFIAYIPQFIQINIGNVFLQFLLFGCLFNFTGALVNTAIVFLSAKLRSYLTKNPLFLKIQQKITGTIFILLSIRLALD